LHRELWAWGGFAARLSGKLLSPDAEAFYQIGYLNTFGRISVISMGAALVIFYYYMSMRAMVAWKLGFYLLLGGYLTSIVNVLDSLYQNARIRDFPSVWLPTGIWAFAGGWIFLNWIVWWSQRKSYFH
jgi:hypothetical protein